MTKQHAKVLIIGSGPAGYTAAIYAARALLNPVLIAGHESGGQLATTTDVENFPGFPEIIQGPWLVEQMRQQAVGVGTTMVSDLVTKLDLKSSPFHVVLDSGGEWTADVVILATGAQARWLGLKSEERLKGFGVSACATCDGFFFNGRDVIVVGGGNTAVEEALYLSKIASKVTVVHRRSEFRAERTLQERLFKTANINVVWNSEIEEVLDSDSSVTGVRVRDVVAGTRHDLAADGVFVAIGHDPATGLVRDQLKLKTSGYLWTAPDSTATSIPGVFAAGDVTDETFRQAITAAGMGCMAALEAEKFLSSIPEPV